MSLPIQSLNILLRHFAAFNGGKSGAFLLLFNSFLALHLFLLISKEKVFFNRITHEASLILLFFLFNFVRLGCFLRLRFHKPVLPDPLCCAESEVRSADRCVQSPQEFGSPL
ncbi:hypothetical protein SDJN02_04137, partial [Cucurbita argyrosperma subsp. argyrosperma]